MKAALLQIRDALRVDDPHGHYDLVCEALAEQPAQGEAVANGRPMTYADAVSHLLELLRLRDLSDLQIDAISVACRVLKSAPPAPSVPRDIEALAKKVGVYYYNGNCQLGSPLYAFTHAELHKFVAMLAASPEPRA